MYHVQFCPIHMTYGWSNFIETRHTHRTHFFCLHILKFDIYTNTMWMRWQLFKSTQHTESVCSKLHDILYCVLCGAGHAFRSFRISIYLIRICGRIKTICRDVTVHEKTPKNTPFDALEHVLYRKPITLTESIFSSRHTFAKWTKFCFPNVFFVFNRIKSTFSTWLF